MHQGHLAAPSGSCSYTPRASPSLMSPALATSSFNWDNTNICPPWASSALRAVQDNVFGYKIPPRLDADAHPHGLIGVFPVVGGKCPSTATPSVSTAGAAPALLRAACPALGR
jgi:hypothetical protein